MEAKGIGIYHSLFYEAYATYLEIQRKLCEADAIYKVGLSRKAQPLAKLKSMYINFLNRMVQIAHPSSKKVISKDCVAYKVSDVQANDTKISPLVPHTSHHPYKKNGTGHHNDVQEENAYQLPVQDVEITDAVHSSGGIEGNKPSFCDPSQLLSQVGVAQNYKPSIIMGGGKPSRRQGVNPWASILITNLLTKLHNKISRFKGYNVCNKKYSGKTCLVSLRNAARNKLLDLGGIKYHIKGCSGEGAFAQVFKALVDGRSDDVVALKIQRPACPWEFYMYRQLDDRISSDERSSFGSAWKVHVYADCSILVCDYVEHGTLQDVINSYLVTGQCMDEVLCMYYTIEMLRMLEALHSAGIIHGDLKPDNLLIRYASDEICEEWNPSRMGGWKDQGLCLIDWGRGIDMNLFPGGTEFEADSKTESFRCIEMQEKRPWTFQVDTYGVCAIAHMMLHGSYMELVKKTGLDGEVYHPKATLKRYWNSALWTNLFTTLLNVRSAENPDLSILRKGFEDHLSSNLHSRKKLTQLLVKQRNVMC
ncbi:mitotic checkpoint serine/threonine-protein kinase BUB1 isoform X2 [Cryptomeria japonica]|nr:mitotic checkpoint serine/threonine-protein kinase BUB1 isoform X2 [Cryptomeria japonica]